jgi:hypothetical protein
MRHIWMIFFFAISLASVEAHAQYPIGLLEDDEGGGVEEYIDKYKILRDSGQAVEISGGCYSACTLVFAFVPAERICVTRSASLVFHAPYYLDAKGREFRIPSYTKTVAQMYPRKMRDFFRKRGGLRSRPIFLHGKELAAMYPQPERQIDEQKLKLDNGCPPSAGIAFYRISYPSLLSAAETLPMRSLASKSVSVLSKDWNTRRNA